MTVKEFRTILSELPDEMDVCIVKPASRGSRFTWCPIYHAHVMGIFGEPQLVVCNEGMRATPDATPEYIAANKATIHQAFSDYQAEMRRNAAEREAKRQKEQEESTGREIATAAGRTDL